MRQKEAGGFSCDVERVQRAIVQQCGDGDIEGVMKVVIGEGSYGASGNNS